MNNRELDIIEIGREVLKTEGEAVLALIPRLGNEFEEAVEILFNCRGRIIVTGMGKTGIIARKFSATLASTGSPSLSLHPVEALHGDLGMVGKDDVVVMVSHSGESEEIKNLIPSIKRLGVTLVGITGNTESTLAIHSDVTLDAGVDREACPLNLAPTSSTTAALAICDALAVALIEKHDFKPADFARLHPGGSLGKRLLLTVSDLMRKGEENPIVGENTLVKEVILRITAAHAGAASVVDRAGHLSGFFTDGDLRRHIETHPDILDLPVGQVMTENPLAVEADKLAAEALRLLGGRKVDELPVINEKGEPVGMLDVQDLLNSGIL
ncbi:MAG: KpsF/GutQ family sugar-phosphate isomerase [Candidatus Auribacterota bacterium]|nr:KpsF/GutQ family sugar-phosphate isomerase [Candidatus Auribacterota bacterium]